VKPDVRKRFEAIEKKFDDLATAYVLRDELRAAERAAKRRRKGGFADLVNDNSTPPFKFEVGQEVRTKNIYETGTPGEGEDELYGFVLDAVRGRVGALIEPERGKFVRKLARLCREYEE